MYPLSLPWVVAPVRIGLLGSARIAPAALMKPSRVVDGIEVGAVAARDRSRAEAFAASPPTSPRHRTRSPT